MSGTRARVGVSVEECIRRGLGDATTGRQPYLYMESQIVNGLDGIDAKLDPGPSSDLPYHAKDPLLPRSLTEALRAGFRDFFVDYRLKLKQAEIDRFNLEVSDWEQREYFSLF